jgi:signal transduction histidine kinase
MGIDVLGKMPWGTHICMFYETKEDLIEVLVPYFKAGLQNNEFCIWVTCEPLDVEEVEKAMKKAVPRFDLYLKKGQMEIVEHSDWYLEEGTFDMTRVLEQWIDKLNKALTNGYAGIRVTGNTAWLSKQTWRNFADYEHAINETISGYRMLALCAYQLNKCSTSEIIDVVNNHQLGLVRQDGKWTLTKNAERKRAEQRACEYQAQLKSLALELSLTEERERRRIASELQDRVSEFLVASKIKLDELRQSVSGRDVGKVLDDISNYLGKAITEATVMAIDLSSPVLYVLGFEKAVAEWLSEEIEKKHGIETEFEDDGQPKPLDDDIRLLLFRFLRELLNNAVKHAQAKKIKVTLRTVSSQIQVCVEDNGIGFDPVERLSMAEPSMLEKRGKIGLFGVQEELQHLGGHLEIDSAPGCGCKVTIVAPLKHSKEMGDKYENANPIGGRPRDNSARSAKPD